MICKSKPKFVLYFKKSNRSWCDMRQTALWTQTGRNRGIPDPLTSTRPQGKLWKAGKGKGRAGDCAESREQPGATGAKEKKN